MITFRSFTGRVSEIKSMGNYPKKGCMKMIAIQNEQGSQINFILSPATYVLHQAPVGVGDLVTGYYNANAPAILIYPPQYPAIVMVKENRHRNVSVGYFDENLTSQAPPLQLHLNPQTEIITTNGQPFTEIPVNQNLVVVYGAATKSIPAQTTPYQIVVLC